MFVTRLTTVYEDSPEWECLPEFIRERKQPFQKRRKSVAIEFDEVNCVPLVDAEQEALCVAMWTKNTPDPIPMSLYLEAPEWERGAACLLTYLSKFEIRAALAGDVKRVAVELGITEDETEALITTWSVSGSESAEAMYRYYRGALDPVGT